MRSAGSVSSAGNCFCVLDFEMTYVPLLNFFFKVNLLCVFVQVFVSDCASVYNQSTFKLAPL